MLGLAIDGDDSDRNKGAAARKVFHYKIHPIYRCILGDSADGLSETREPAPLEIATEEPIPTGQSKGQIYRSVKTGTPSLGVGVIPTAGRLGSEFQRGGNCNYTGTDSGVYLPGKGRRLTVGAVHPIVVGELGPSDSQP